jgi:hypothetical protein
MGVTGRRKRRRRGGRGGGRLRAEERGPSVTACISYNKIIRM